MGTVATSVTNSGATIAPGTTAAAAGTLTITGNYTQGAAGTLSIDLGGTESGTFDVLAVSGASTLDGTLRLALTDDFEPPHDSAFDVLTFASRSGDFSTTEGFQQGSATFSKSYSATVLTLTASNPSFQLGSNDLDGNGLADDWEMANFGRIGVDPAGDADADGEDNLAESRSGTDPNDASSVRYSARVVNFSTRMAVTEENVLISGFIIDGTEPRSMMIRGIAPSLAGEGIAGVMNDPAIELFDALGKSIARNDNWQEAQIAEVEATTIAPAHENEAAMVRTLPPGSYTVRLTSADQSPGIALIEVYDLAVGRRPSLANVSTRGVVESGDEVMIGGFVIAHGAGVNGSGSVRVVVRAIGPSTAGAGVSTPLPDPTLALYNASGDLVASNNDWHDAGPHDVTETGLAPGADLESALLITLPAGPYTAVISGTSGTSGTAVVEVYTLR